MQNGSVISDYTGIFVWLALLAVGLVAWFATQYFNRKKRR